MLSTNTDHTILMGVAIMTVYRSWFFVDINQMPGMEIKPSLWLWALIFIIFNGYSEAGALLGGPLG